MLHATKGSGNVAKDFEYSGSVSSQQEHLNINSCDSTQYNVNNTPSQNPKCLNTSTSTNGGQHELDYFSGSGSGGDFVPNEEMAHMLQSYLTYSPNPYQGKKEEDDSSGINAKNNPAPIVIPPAPDSIDSSSHLPLPSRPASAVSSSSVVSPSSVAGYEVNQSPGQQSNDSGFSGDFSQPLSVQVNAFSGIGDVDHKYHLSPSQPFVYNSATQSLLKPMHFQNSAPYDGGHTGGGCVEMANNYAGINQCRYASSWNQHIYDTCYPNHHMLDSQQQRSYCKNFNYQNASTNQPFYYQQSCSNFESPYNINYHVNNHQTPGLDASKVKYNYSKDHCVPMSVNSSANSSSCNDLINHPNKEHNTRAQLQPQQPQQKDLSNDSSPFLVSFNHLSYDHSKPSPLLHSPSSYNNSSSIDTQPSLTTAGSTSVTNGQFNGSSTYCNVGVDCDDILPSYSNGISSIAGQEDLSRIVDQVLNSFDGQFSPPLTSSSHQCPSLTHTAEVLSTKQEQITTSSVSANNGIDHVTTLTKQFCLSPEEDEMTSVFKLIEEEEGKEVKCNDKMMGTDHKCFYNDMDVDPLNTSTTPKTKPKCSTLPLLPTSNLCDNCGHLNSGLSKVNNLQQLRDCDKTNPMCQSTIGNVEDCKFCGSLMMIENCDKNGEMVKEESKMTPVEISKRK